MQKKFKPIIVKLVTLLTTSSLLISCNKQDVSPISQTLPIETPTVVDGRLQFKTIDGFGSYIRNIKELPKSNPNARKEFVSYYELQQSKLNESSNSRLSADLEEIIITDTTYIPNSFLSSVINEKREVGIGNDSIFKFGSDFTFVYLATDTAYISQFYQDYKNNLINITEGNLLNYKNKIKVAKTVQTIISDSTTTATKSGNSRILASVGGDAYFNDNEKVCGQVYSSNYFFYSVCGAKTFAQRKVRKRFLWWSWDSWSDLFIGELYFKCTGYSELAVSKCKGCGTGGFGGSYFEYESPKRSGSNNEKVFADLYGFNLPKITLTGIKSYHYGIHWGVKREVNVFGNIY